MESFFVGVWGIVAFFILLALGLPVAFSLLGVSFVGLTIILGLKASFSMITNLSFNYLSNYTMSVVPLFIFMGVIASVSGILEESFDVAKKWFGGLKGGLGFAAITANTIFAAASGSSVSACVVVGRGAMPAMRKSNYPKDVTAGIIAASGTIAAVIPPSILICIYGLIVDESIGELFIGGIIPGIIEAASYFVIVSLVIRNVEVKGLEKNSLVDKIRHTSHLWVVLIVILAVMGTIYTGVCTPTEAGAIGAMTVFILSLCLKRLTFDKFKKILKETAKTSCMILFILLAAGAFSRFLLVSGFTKTLVFAATEIATNRYTILILILLCYLFLGCFITAAGMLVISLPLFYPVVVELGFHPIWFGIISVTLCETALITPPLGLNAYVTNDLDQEIPLSTVFKGCSYFLIADIFRLTLDILFPSIILFLPSKM